jgi:hypothetical protein
MLLNYIQLQIANISLLYVYKIRLNRIYIGRVTKFGVLHS